MSRSKLLPSEIETIKKLQESRIPWAFKDEYLDFLLTVENIAWYLTEDLLSKKKIGDWSEDFKIVMGAIKIEDLDEDAKQYYSKLVAVMEIYNKYYGK